MEANTTKVKQNCTVDDVCDWLQTHHYPLTALELYYEMEERYGETGTYSPLLAFAERTAQSTSQNEQRTEEETCRQEQQEEQEKEYEELVHEHKCQTMNMLKSELVQCLRILYAQEGVNGIQELLMEADIALPLLALEESKNVKYALQPSSEPLQLLPPERKQSEQYDVHTEEQDVENMKEVSALRKERNELAHELEWVKNNLHSCTSQLMESLTSLVNAIDVTRRELLLPLYRLTAMYSSASSERVLARRQLLHLHKHPIDEVRKRIVKEWLALIFLSSTPSPSRETTWLQLEREILPELFHLGNSRLVEQRLLALECVCSLSTQLTLVINSTNSVLRKEYSREQLENKKVIYPIFTKQKNNTNLDTCSDTTLHVYTRESVEAVERIYGLLYHGLLRPLCDDTSALVREQVVMCIASLWPSFQTTSIECTQDMCNNDSVEISTISDKNSKPIVKHVLLTETLPRMTEMIIELALDAASGIVRHVAQAQLRSVIFVKSFQSHVLLSSFVPLLLVFVEKELREMLQLTTSSSSVLSFSESPSTLPTTNYNTENISKPHTASSIANTTAAPAVAATVVTSDQNAQSVFAHTRPSTLRSMLKGNVYSLIRLIHDALHCAVAQTIHLSKQRLVKVEECNNTCNVTNGKNIAHVNVSHASCKEHKEHITLEQKEEQKYEKDVELGKIATRMKEIINNHNDDSDDECKTNLVRHEVNQVYTSVVLPSFTQTMQNICVMATGNKRPQIQQEEEESTLVDVVCRLSYTMALFCKLFDWHTWLQVQKHLLLTVQSEHSTEASINPFNPESKLVNNGNNNNNTNTNTVKITEKPQYILLRMVFAFLLRVASESALGNEQNMEICKIKEINSMAVSHDEFVCRISKSATVCLVHLVASGVAPRYTSDECFNVAAEVIAQSASAARHDLKLTRAIKRVLKVMYNFVVYKDECNLECDANISMSNNKNNNKSEMENEQTENNNKSRRGSTDDLTTYTESCQLWCIVFIVKICEELDKEDEEITSTLFCAFLHHLIDKTTDDNQVDINANVDAQDNISVKVKEEVICALMQTVLPLNDVNEQLALLTPALEILNGCKITAHIYEHVLHIMFILISRGITAEAREIIIYPFLEMIINKLSESSLSYAEMSSTVNELMQVLEAILRCAVVTPSLVNEHLLKPMMEFTTHKLKRTTTTTTANETLKTNMSAMTSVNINMSSTKAASVPNSHDKWLDLLLRYQGFVERNRENSFVSHFVSSPLLIRMKDELRKRLERM